MNHLLRVGLGLAGQVIGGIWLFSWVLSGTAALILFLAGLVDFNPFMLGGATLLGGICGFVSWKSAQAACAAMEQHAFESPGGPQGVEIDHDSVSATWTVDRAHGITLLGFLLLGVGVFGWSGWFAFDLGSSDLPSPWFVVLPLILAYAAPVWLWIRSAWSQLGTLDRIEMLGTLDEIRVIRSGPLRRRTEELPIHAATIRPTEGSSSGHGIEVVQSLGRRLWVPCGETPAREELVRLLRQMAKRPAGAPAPPVPETLKALRSEAQPEKTG